MWCTKKTRTEKRKDDWKAIFRCCSRDPEQMARMMQQFACDNPEDSLGYDAMMQRMKQSQDTGNKKNMIEIRDISNNQNKNQKHDNRR